MPEVALPTLKCYRCGHRWVPRKSPVRSCPRCRSTRYATLRGPSAAKTDRIYRAIARQPPIDWEEFGDVRARYDVRRRRAKDALLIELGMRASVTHGSS